MRGQLRTTEDLGRMVAAIRMREGMTQVELAEHLGVTRRYLSELETGSKPKVLGPKLFAVLDELGIQLGFTEVTDE